MNSRSFRLAMRFKLSTVLFCTLLSLSGAAREAKADFIGYYTLSNFTLTNNGGIFPNGSVSSLDPTTIVLTGTNDGSGISGTTDLTISTPSDGFFQFDYLFNTLDAPTYEYAGYLLGAGFYQLADTDGQSGSVNVPVSAGETIGFRVGSFDNTGSPGVLTVTNFSAPTPEPNPEPGTLAMLLSGVAVSLIGRRMLRKHLLRTISAFLLAVAVGAIGITAPALAQQFSYFGNNVTGQLTLATVVNLRQQAQTPAGAQAFRAQGAERIKLPPPRLRPPFGASRALNSLAAPAPLQSLSVVAASGAFGFNALSHLDQRNAFGGNQFSIEPPNQSIAVGDGYVLEGVNDAVQIYNVSGAPSLPIVLASNQVFGLAPAIDRSTGVNGVYLTDMRVFFDQGIDRWFVVMRSQDNDAAGNELNSSHLYIAVSQTGDPTANYNIYIMNTTNPGHPGCPCVDDYPQIGADQYGFHIAWNEFNTPSLQFLDAAILSLSKASLAAGASQPAAYQFLLPYSSGFEFAIQPATTPPGAANFVGSGGLEYFASTSSSFFQANEISLWAMTNTSSLATSSPSPSMIRVTVPSLAYAPPDVATQPSGYAPLGASQGAPTEFLDGGDPRVQALSYASGRLYLTFPTGVTDQNGHWVVGGAYMVLSPTYRSGTLAAQVLSQGYLFVNSNHVLRPAIAVNAKGTGAVAVTLVGSAGNYYPTAAFIPFQISSAPTTLEIAAPGASPEDGFTGYPIGYGVGVARWGDYNTAVASSDGAIWMVMQYIGNYPRTTLANWNTYVVRQQP